MKPAAERLIADAADRIAAMDEVDRRNGEGYPIPLDVALGNVEAALFSAIETADWGTVADALVMLQQRNDPSKVRWSPR